jgi:uncharacterized protein YbjT (DUF2867 family)
MKAIVFGASGMVGQGVVRECVASVDVEAVLLVGRGASGLAGGKVRELVIPDLHDYAAVADELAGHDACFFCLGVSSSGMTEDAYRKVTHDLTLAAARALLASNPELTFCYVSGAGTDSTEQGRSMWARVKGKTENDLLGLGFRRAFMFRPGYIQPLDGIKSKTRSYRIMYAVMAPLYRLWKLILPKQVTTTRNLGLAMLAVARGDYEKTILDSHDINVLAGQRNA